MRNDDDDTTVNPQRQNALEPRVAALEVGLDRLTADVKDLATVVRMQGQTVEQEIQKLVVAVTQAQGPKKTDWGTIIAGVGLILAIGSAVFWPLNQKTDYMMQNIATIQQKVEEHQRMDNHPVGAALVQRLEGQIQAHVESNQREFKQHIETDVKELETARQNIQEQIALAKATADAEMKGVKEKTELYIDKLYGRVLTLEEANRKEIDMDRAELMQWRQKAMGLNETNK